MSLIDIDSWITEYEGCDRLSRDIQSLIVQRNGLSAQTDKYAQISANIRLRLKQLSTELQQLSSHMNNLPLTVAEEERRRRQIETLQSKLIQLQTQYADANGAASISRTQLFQPQHGNRLWEDDDGEDDDDDLIQPSGSSGRKPYTVEEMRKQQTRILDDQDEGLDALSKIISRQKELAIKIGDEVETQNDIIDDLADDMERTDARVNSETRHVRSISTSESGTCTYWLIIIGLFVAILIASFV